MTRIAVLLAMLVAGCRPDCTPATGDSAPIVLLVTVDTLRADHLAPYGNTRVRTPTFARLAAEGVRFERSYAAANATIPSHASLFTSQPVARHGLTSNNPHAVRPTETVQARFRAAGYRTAAFVSAYHVGPKMAFGTLLGGVEPFEAPRRISQPLRADATVDATLAWLRGACRAPAFAWVHLWDPHMPYTPPKPFDRAYWSGGDPQDPANHSMDGIEWEWAMLDTAHLREALAPHAAAVRDLKRRLGVSSRRVKRLVQWPPDMREHPAGETAYPELLAELSPTLAQLQHTLPFNKTIAGMLTGVRDVEYPRALYAGEVSYADAELGRLVTTLESWGLRDRLVVAVTADHGEGMGEHDIYFAHTGLWEEMIRVPLVFWMPGRLPPAVRNDFASGLDVAPTLLGLVGLPAGPTMEGRNLATASAADALVSESILGSQVALRTGDWKLVRTLRDYYSTTKFHREAATVELYDLAHDPRETANLAASDPGRTAALSAQLDAWLAAHGVRADAPAPPSVPERDRDRLRALGYVE